MLEGKHDVVSTDMLFDCMVESFDFRNVFITQGYVKYSVKISEVASHGLELIVS